MRVIELGEDHEKATSLFMLISTCGFQGRPPHGLDGFRNLTKLQDAIEAVSTEVKIEGITTHKLNDGVTQLVLNDAPWELLKTRFFEAGIDWLSAAARRVTEAYDVVCAAKEVKPEDIKA